MLEIERRRANDLAQFAAVEDGKDLGYLFFDPTPTPKGLEIKYVGVKRHVDSFRVVKPLVKAFVALIGPNQAVFSDITNYPTLRRLDRSGLLSQAIVESRVEVTNPIALTRIPIVRAATSLGIRTQSVSIESQITVPDASDKKAIEKALEEARQRDYINDFFVEMKAST